MRQIEVPLKRYTSRTELIFPLSGAFVVIAGHDVNEPHRRGWSQQFAYDAINVGPDFQIARSGGRANEDFFTWGRDVLAPAGGTVAYARNDVPDQRTPGRIDRSYESLPDVIDALAGNNVLIDHGNGEYSSLGHLQRGSVRLRIGDTVARGELIGRVWQLWVVRAAAPPLSPYVRNAPVAQRWAAVAICECVVGQFRWARAGEGRRSKTWRVSLFRALIRYAVSAIGGGT